MKNSLISLISIPIFLFSCATSAKIQTEPPADWQSNYPYIMVHGICGWGDTDFKDNILHYWGLQTGSLPKQLSDQGFYCRQATVDPLGSAWDRACELYAQLTGTVVDYGEAHSQKNNHRRFGKSYRGKALVKNWSQENKVNFIAHSFGGATVRLLCQLMEEGSEEEMQATDSGSVSPLFEGGHSGWIHSITAIAAPHNGTSAFHLTDTGSDYFTTSLLIMATKPPKKDKRLLTDSASHDLRIDSSAELNKSLKTFDHIYYFSFPCDGTIVQNDGICLPDKKAIEPIFQKCSTIMGTIEGSTDDGTILGNEWRKNDGLANTISELYPFNEPHRDFCPTEIAGGIWNVAPVYHGDHMSLLGGLTIKNRVKDLYLTHLDLINRLPVLKKKTVQSED